MGKVLGGFHDQAERWMTGWLLQRTTDGKCPFISAVTSKEEAGSLTVEDYIWRQQNTVAQYISTQ